MLDPLLSIRTIASKTDAFCGKMSLKQSTKKKLSDKSLQYGVGCPKLFSRVSKSKNPPKIFEIFVFENSFEKATKFIFWIFRIVSGIPILESLGQPNTGAIFRIKNVRIESKDCTR